MDFIDEQNSFFLFALPNLFGVVDDLPDFFDTGEYGRKRDEIGFRFTGQDARQRGFPGTGRPPENH